MPHPFVLLVTANPASGALDDSVALTVRERTSTGGRWLQHGAVFEAPIDHPAIRETFAAMRASPTGAVIDHADLRALLHLRGL